MKTRIAGCGHQVPSHPGRQRRRCDACGPSAPQRVPRPGWVTCVWCRRETAVAVDGPVPTYCSANCRAGAAYGRARGHAAPLPRYTTCRNCGVELAPGKRKYCSLWCNEVGAGQRRAEPLPLIPCALPECGLMFVPHSEKQYCCSEKHAKRVYNHRTRDGVKRPPQPWTDARRDRSHRRRAARKGTSCGDAPVLMADIAERDGWCCGICGKPVDPQLVWPHRMSRSLDHIVPLSKGGWHMPENVRLAHVSCNSGRGNRL